MASRPHYNLNTREGLQEGAYHFAVQSLYEPGSTFKIVSVTSAVDSGKATFDTMINCTPYMVPSAPRPVTDAPVSTAPDRGGRAEKVQQPLSALR